jgi:ElaB/YqjD/DUF883 family membrane-anchored ribosome-binding protein
MQDLSEQHPGESSEHLESSAREAKKSLEELKGAATAAGAEVRKIGTKHLRDLRHASESYTREQPLPAILCALGIGFVLGLMARR